MFTVASSSSISDGRILKVYDMTFFYVSRAPSWARTSSLSRLQDYTRWDSSVWVIRLTQKPLPDNIQHLTRDWHPCHGGIRTRNPSKRAASYPPTTRQHTKFTKVFITSKMSYDCTVHSRCVVSYGRQKVNGIFDVHIFVYRKYISKVQPTRCNVFLICLFL
jgi:hypothetical protein